MSTRNKIRLRKERVEIISLMKTTSYYKKQLIEFEKKLSRAYEENRIDKEEYLRRLNEGLQGRTLRQLLRYYDQCINVYNTRVVEIDRELRELEKSRNLLPILTIFAFVALLGLSYYFIQPAITGFTLIENGTNATESVFRIQLVNINISEETGIIETTEIENDRLIQVKAEINKPVEWKLITRNKTIELPLEASNIEVNKLINETEDIKEKARLKNQFGANNLNNKKLIEVDELNETKLEVTYKTKAPYSIESNLTQNKDLISKDITIKSDSEVHYQNVLSYTNLDPEIQNKEQLKLYHYVYNNQTNTTEKTDITTNQLYNLSYEDTNNNQLIDKIYFYVPQLSEQNFSVEISLTILTIQSYPAVGGNWTVLFNTTGTADLKIKASNGTSWSNDLNSTGTDLTFLELKCGTAIQNYQWLNNSVLISNYQCNETSQEISKVLTTGVHTIEFTFGNITKYAYNLADRLNLILLSPINKTVTQNFSVTLNISVENNATQVIIYAGNSSNLDYNNIVFLNKSILGADTYNFTYNFTSLPIKPTGTDGLKVLYHFDNITNFENITRIHDWSLNNNNASCYNNIGSLSCAFNYSGKYAASYPFDGLNDYLKTPYAYNQSEITVSFWLNPNFNAVDSSKSLNRLFVFDAAVNVTVLGTYSNMEDRFVLSVTNDTTWTNTGDLASATNVYSLIQSSDGTLYAGTGSTNGDVFKSTDNGTTWTGTGDLLSASTVWSLLQSSDGTLYAGTSNNGDVFKSTNNGTTWENTGNLVSASIVFTLLQSSDGTLYAGTSPEGDVFKSADNGTTWENTGNFMNTEVYSLLQSSDGTLYAGTGFDGDVFKSADNGTTWENTGNLLNAATVDSLLQSSDGTLYAGTSNNGDVFKSTNNGTTWKNTGNLASTSIVYSLLQSSDGTLYAGTGSTNGDVFKSTDNGTTWKNTGNLVSTSIVYSLLQSSDGTLYAGTNPNGDVFKINTTFIRSSTQTFNQGDWIHLLFILNNSGKKMFINAKEESSDTLPFSGISLS